MQFSQSLIPATLIRRYKRFLADVETDQGEVTTVYCPNTGAMLGCDQPGSRVWLSRAANPKRKYPLTWELVQPPGGPVIGINTGLTNALVAEALQQNRLPELRCDDFRREVTVTGGRLDFLLDPQSPSPRQLEVKNVTAAVANRMALFPDARSVRAVRHLQHLSDYAASGPAALLFCVQREDVDAVRPATEIDPQFAAALSAAQRAGVMLLAYRWRVSPREICLDRAVRVDL